MEVREALKAALSAGDSSTYERGKCKRRLSTRRSFLRWL